ncbi:sucrose synthase [Artemisia annua]|uniref:Sucrose synthase n=1 Tax=Artemisia annua TaxID=35608 RepID=A0A2U1L617_ARTAN|nr:sucrose synthase [Artemisia annua]
MEGERLKRKPTNLNNDPIRSKQKHHHRLPFALNGAFETWLFLWIERLLTLDGVYGFWKYVSKLDIFEIRRYLEMFYALKYCILAESVPLAVDEEK